jgi:hypothetical protein
MTRYSPETRLADLARTAALPDSPCALPDVLARVPAARRRRLVVRSAAAAAAAAAVTVAAAVASGVLGLSSGQQASAAVARQSAATLAHGTGLGSFELTLVTRNYPVGFQPEPPPPRAVTGVQYADPGHWREVTTVTEPSGQGTQTITQVRNGQQLATISGGKVSVEPAPSGGSGLPLPGYELPLRQLLAAGLGGRCAPSAALGGQGPVIDGRPTIVLQIGASPCPSADAPQLDGPATYWLDARTDLVLRAQLHGPQGQLAETVQATSLSYSVAFPPGTFTIPRPSPPTACPVITTLPGMAALRRALAYPPLVPAVLPSALRAGAIGSSGAMTGGCKLTDFTITYDLPSGRPAVQLYEAPSSSPAVRFPGRPVALGHGITGTLGTGYGMTVLWWIQDGRYCALQSGGVTAGVPLAGVPQEALIRMAASTRH